MKRAKIILTVALVGAAVLIGLGTKSVDVRGEQASTNHEVRVAAQDVKTVPRLAAAPSPDQQRERIGQDDEDTMAAVDREARQAASELSQELDEAKRSLLEEYADAVEQIRNSIR